MSFAVAAHGGVEWIKSAEYCLQPKELRLST